MARIKRKDERRWQIEIFDGRATATVYVVDGYDRAVSDVYHVAGPVHDRREVIAAVYEDAATNDRAAAMVAMVQA